MDFKIGDAVKLKEGVSPVMTVSFTDDQEATGYVECKWYLSSEGKFTFDKFHKDMLKHYTKRGLLDKG